MIDVDTANADAECGPIVSTLSLDPDMIELVEIFVAEVPDKVERIVSFEASQNWPELKRAAHQLKGSAGGYGFDCLAPTCQQLEQMLQEAPEPWQVAQLTQLLVTQLLQLRAH